MLGARREVGLQVNTEKTECMFMSLQQNAEQTHNIPIINKFFENVVKSKYVKSTITITIINSNESKFNSQSN
jgi:hypothetical protein